MDNVRKKALENNRFEIAQYLVKHNEINIYLIFREAAENGKFEVVKFLAEDLKHKIPNSNWVFKISADVAAKNGHKEIELYLRGKTTDEKPNWGCYRTK